MVIGGESKDKTIEQRCGNADGSPLFLVLGRRGKLHESRRDVAMEIDILSSSGGIGSRISKGASAADHRKDDGKWKVFSCTVERIEGDMKYGRSIDDCVNDLIVISTLEVLAIVPRSIVIASS